MTRMETSSRVSALSSLGTKHFSAMSGAPVDASSVSSIRLPASSGLTDSSLLSVKAKKLLTKRNQTHSVSLSDESFCSPGSLDDDEMEIPVNLIFRRPRVRNRRNACTKAPCGVDGVIYIANVEGSYGSGYEVGRSVSMTTDNSNHLNTNDDHQYQGPCDILEERECELEPGGTASHGSGSGRGCGRC